MISTWFSSGRIIDAIVLMVLLEGGLIWFRHRRTGRGLSLIRALPVLASGVLLLLAIKAALVQAPWPLVALPLTGALIAHLLDLQSRWPR